MPHSRLIGYSGIYIVVGSNAACLMVLRAWKLFLAPPTLRRHSAGLPTLYMRYLFFLATRLYPSAQAKEVGRSYTKSTLCPTTFAFLPLLCYSKEL